MERSDKKRSEVRSEGVPSQEAERDLRERERERERGRGTSRQPVISGGGGVGPRHGPARGRARLLLLSELRLGEGRLSGASFSDAFSGRLQLSSALFFSSLPLCCSTGAPAPARGTFSKASAERRPQRFGLWNFRLGLRTGCVAGTGMAARGLQRGQQATRLRTCHLPLQESQARPGGGLIETTGDPLAAMGIASFPISPEPGAEQAERC